MWLSSNARRGQGATSCEVIEDEHADKWDNYRLAGVHRKEIARRAADASWNYPTSPRGNLGSTKCCMVAEDTSGESRKGL